MGLHERRFLVAWFSQKLPVRSIRRKESIMRYTALSFLTALALIPGTSKAQLTAEAVTKFVVPEANALAVSIALHGDTAMLGTLDAEAYVFQLDRGVWFMDRLVVPGVGLHQGSFTEVALDENLAIIGDWPRAYVFRFDGATWNYEATLTHTEGNRGFGHTVDIDGDLAVIGTRSDDVHVFRFYGGAWKFDTMLVPPPREDGKNPYGYADQVVVDGERVLVRKSATMGDGFEGVYVFRHDGVKWFREGILTLGEDEDGTTIFQGDIALDGDVALIDADYDDVVYVFRFDEGSWKQEEILGPPDLGNPSCACLPIPTGNPVDCRDDSTPNFGVSVAIDGDFALVGANLDDVTNTDSGAAYLYRFDGTRWKYELLLSGEQTSYCGSDFGRMVEIYDGRALVKQGRSAYFFRIR
jgi:hypothetical protein